MISIEWTDCIVQVQHCRYYRMIDICETYANNNGLIFNEKKSVVITFVKSRFVSDRQLVIQGHRLSWASRLTHLGIVLDMVTLRLWRVEPGNTSVLLTL